LGVKGGLSVIYLESTLDTMSQIKEIISLYLEKHQSEEIRQRFFHWLKSSISSKEKEEALTRFWEELSVSADLSTEKAYHQVQQRLGFSKKQTSKRLFYIRIAQVAAILLIPLLSFITARWYVDNRLSSNMELVEHYVPYGEIREIRLPDSSRVIMNSGSLLFYHKDLSGKIRDLYLSGEAKFTVWPDKKRPFVVRTNDMSVEALGTVFNISSYPDNPHTMTTLIEGKVGVDIALSENKFILSPGEQIIYNKETGETLRKEARLDYVLAWEKGGMVFRSASLYSVVKELERRYGVTVYLNAAGLNDEKLTVKFLYDETPEEILDALKQIITGFKYKIEGEKIFIY